MTLRRKIWTSILVLLLVAFAAAEYAFRYPPPPHPAPVPADPAQRMKAVVRYQYGSPDVLQIVEVEKPAPADNEMLIKVHAASINPLEYHFMRGTPYLIHMFAGWRAPKNYRLGVDFAGTIVAVGKNVSRFKVGDDVFGGADGALAEYIDLREDDRALMAAPSNMNFGQAASVPIAGITALQALRDKGHIHAGEKVLVNGASGGVGTFAVQIAKSYGAEVTGVCSTRNLELVRSLGADHVIDYTKEDFTQAGQQYDLIIDTVGSHALLQYRHALTPTGTLVIVGGATGDPWLGALDGPIRATLLKPFVSQHFVLLLADVNRKADLDILRDLMQTGKLTPVIDRHYPMAQVQDAMRYLEAGHTRGKVVIDID
jgi:NADPH:quinone reductase-like Zn-dependent oxidoreductase